MSMKSAKAMMTAAVSMMESTGVPFVPSTWLPGVRLRRARRVDQGFRAGAWAGDGSATDLRTRQNRRRLMREHGKRAERRRRIAAKIELEYIAKQQSRRGTIITVPLESR